MTRLLVTANGLTCGIPALDQGPAPELRQIAASRLWLRCFARRTDKVRREHTSYFWKHRVEDWTSEFGCPFAQVDDLRRAWQAPYLYISNGAFIEAAQLEGLEVHRVGRTSLNAFFNFDGPRPPRRSRGTW